MVVHIVKLSVGSESLADLAEWQAGQLAKKKKCEPQHLTHVTRMTPKRQSEVLNGGSIYWVIKGIIQARQEIVDLTEVTRNGIPHCGIVYDARLIPVAPRAMRPFQGWRYLKPEAAPRDMGGALLTDLPPELSRQLLSLGLL